MYFPLWLGSWRSDVSACYCVACLLHHCRNPAGFKDAQAPLVIADRELAVFQFLHKQAAEVRNVLGIGLWCVSPTSNQSLLRHFL